MLHSDFNRKLKKSSNNSDIKQYEASVSAFAASHIVSAYEAAAKLTGTKSTSEDDSFTFGSNSATNSSCTCTAHTGFGLPCKHIFYVCKQLGMPAFEIALCHTQWLSHDNPVIGATPSTSTSSTVHTQITSVTPRHKTRAERFKTAMMIFTSMASTLSDLPPQRFAKCLLWLHSIENTVRDGTWENITEAVEEDDDSAVSEHMVGNPLDLLGP